MNKYPVKQKQQVPSTPEQNADQVASPFPASPWFGANRFFSFHHSYSEISAHGDKTIIKAKKTTLENGKLTREEFEGTMERSAYDEAINQTHSFMQSQTQLLLNSFSLLLPFQKKLPPKQD